MAIRTDRVGEFVEGVRHKKKQLVSPEGVPLEIRIANRGERIAALCLDLFFLFAAVFVLFLIMVFFLFSHLERSRNTLLFGYSVFTFLLFLVRNCYFLHFELAWQGRTPGKKICGLRVINRDGGELTPSAVIARNLTREVEVFIPLGFLFSAGNDTSSTEALFLLGWVAAFSFLPLLNKERLRLGDLIGGTQVISMPQRALLDDLTLRPAASPPAPSAAVSPTSGVPAALPETPAASSLYRFTHEQLAIYGAFELQVLEEFLRRKPSRETDRLLEEVCGKICRKIGWTEAVPPNDVRRFLNDFYTAERADLERGQLFGVHKADKSTPAAPQGGDG